MKHIKTGEENKKKIYRALCIVKEPVTVEIMQRLNVPDGFTIDQLTPLRVLHRRPLLKRPRRVYSVNAYVNKGNFNYESHHKLRAYSNTCYSHYRQPSDDYSGHCHPSWNLHQGIGAWRVRSNKSKHLFDHRTVDRYCSAWRYGYWPWLADTSGQSTEYRFNQYAAARPPDKHHNIAVLWFINQ